MNFCSVSYLAFLGLISSLYYWSGSLRFRQWLLLIASYCFYASWHVHYVTLLLIATSVTFSAALFFERCNSKAQKRLLLTIALTTNLGLLFVFKYLDFFIWNVNSVLSDSTVPFSFYNILLPVGISFYIFQATSYTLDCYKGRADVVRDPIVFALYLCFFPQLVAGPIEKASALIPQLQKKATLDYHHVTDGLKMIAWGMFKKLVIANNISPVVDLAYQNYLTISPLALVIATLLFSYQIYCDFSGYCDIAKGSASVLGIRLMNNFGRPYAARSMPDYWRRWHISLSTWFRDYIYFPLGGSRRGELLRARNLFAAFLCSGLWHGAKWTFVIWGGLHATYTLISILMRPVKQRILVWSGYEEPPQWFVPFQVCWIFLLASSTRIFFRAPDAEVAVTIVQRIYHAGISLFDPLFTSTTNFFLSLELLPSSLLIIVSSIVILELVQSAGSKGSLRQKVRELPAAVRWLLYYGIAIWIGLFGNFESQSFIYFQF